MTDEHFTRFKGREEIQFRCYQFGHVHVTAHDPVPVFWEPGQAHGVRGDGVGGSP